METAPTEERLKIRLWPSIQSRADVDYRGAQGYWLCSVIAIYFLIVSAFISSTTPRGRALAGIFLFLFYYLGGVGVRERSRYAAVVLMLFSVVNMVGKPSLDNGLFAVLFLLNLWVTWIASRWRPESEEAELTSRLGETWRDKFVDELPKWLWPRVRFFYYQLSFCLLLFRGFFVGLQIMGMKLQVVDGHLLLTQLGYPFLCAVHL